MPGCHGGKKHDAVQHVARRKDVCILRKPRACLALPPKDKPLPHLEQASQRVKMGTLATTAPKPPGGRHSPAIVVEGGTTPEVAPTCVYMSIGLESKGPCHCIYTKRPRA